jgi:hypothetical protein
MLLLSAISILLTADGDGASGRQFVPLLPHISGVQLQSAGYAAVTQGARVCLTAQLGEFHDILKNSPQRRSALPFWALRTRLSWMLSATPSELLPELLENEPRWHAALRENWVTAAGKSIDCYVLKDTPDAEQKQLKTELRDWNIRWSARASLPRIGEVIEVARPIGDGSRRLHHVHELRRKNPMLIWVNLGRLLEGWSWLRDGASLHRSTTSEWLKDRGPELLLPAAEDAVVGAQVLHTELDAMGSSLLDSFSKDSPEHEQAFSLWRDGERLAFIGLSPAFEQLPAAKSAQRLNSIFKRLSDAGPIHRAILLARSAQAAAPYLDDSRFQIIAVPAGLNSHPREGSFSLPKRAKAERNHQPPVLVRVPRNAVVRLTINGGKAELSGDQIDERRPAVLELSRKVNALRHKLYPKLLRPFVPALSTGHFDNSKTVDLIAATLLPAAQADALMLPNLAPSMTLPGGLSRLDLLARLAQPSALVMITVDGGALKKLTTHAGIIWRSREKLIAGRPLRLITNQALARRYKTQLGTRDYQQMIISDQGLKRVQTKGASLPRIVMPLLERALETDVNLDNLMRLPPGRSRLLLRIDKLQLSAFANRLQAPSERRALEDARTHAPSRTSLGFNSDLKLLQPLHTLTSSLRFTGAYTRDLFPEDGGTAALDKESLDDWKLTAELMRGSGAYRPFTNLLWDSEFSAGDPTQSIKSPRQKRAELNAGVAVPKSGKLHEARLAATVSQDLSRQLADSDPSPELAFPGSRFAISGLADWRRKVGKIEVRLVIDGRYYLPESEPLASTLLWAMGERLELAVPMAAGLRGAVVLQHTLWRTHDEVGASGLGDHQFSAGFSLDFLRVMRPLAGVF